MVVVLFWGPTMKKKDRLERRAELAPLDVIRVETAIARFPLHRLAKAGVVEIVIREQNAEGDFLRWKVSHNSEYGQPGPLAYKVDTLIVNRRVEEAGRPIPRIIRLGSLNDICRELGLVESGANTNKVKRAIHQNASAYITAKIRYKSADGAERRIEVGDTRYGVVFTGEKLPDGRTADAVYIVPHDFYREILDNVLVRPLDYDYLKGLPPASQRLYEVVSYAMFATLKNHRPRARLVYSEFCRLAPLTRHFDWEHARKQMAKIHAPHLRAGYLAEVAFEATTDHEGRPDWTMSYTPGPKAKAEHQAFTRRGGTAMLAIEPPPAEAKPPKVEPEPAGLERELVSRGVTRGVAAELVATYSEERLRAQLERLDWLRETKPKRVKDLGAYLVEAIREDYAPPAGFASQADRDQREAIARAQEEQARQAKAHEREIQAREEAIQKRITAYWEGLTTEEQARLEAAALAEAPPEQRQVYEDARLPSFRRTYLQTLRQEHLRRLLDLPVSG